MRRPRNSALRPVSGWVRTSGWRAPGTLLTSETFSKPLCARPPLVWVAAWIAVLPSIRVFTSAGKVS